MPNALISKLLEFLERPCLCSKKVLPFGTNGSYA